MGDDDAAKAIAVRSKSKKTLCSYFAQKKTRVGCSTNEHDEVISQKPPNILTHLDFLSKSDQTLINDQTLTSHTPITPHKITGKEFDYSTKIALCCAMTEGAKTTISRQSPSLIRDSDGKSKLHLLYDSDSSEQSSSKTPGAQSKDRSFEENTQINKTVELKQTSRENKHNGPRFYQRRSSSPTTSEVSSIDSSHSQASGRLLQNRRPILSQRRSADNLVASVSSINGSPPVSSRSVSHAHKYKKRSASHDTMLLPNSKSRENNTKLEKNPDSSSTTGSSKNQKFVASMDSLARHSLLAAQVLHLIPTIKARERNFLHGRIAANSLLGSLELERTLPHRELRIFVGTWNMNGQAPPEELNDFMLPSTLEHVPDVVTVGTQESFSERFEWEVSIQETLGPSHLLLHSAVLGTLHLAVFIRRDLLWFCSVAEESSYSVRPGTAFRTKGAVAIAFMLFGTSYLFITSHLTAHMDKVKERVQDVKRIMRALDLPKILPIRHKSKDVTQNFDYVFWCGDLNFRLSQPREEVLQWVSEQEFPLPLPHSLHCDQLKTIITEGSIFQDFEEGPITFPPTYKYDPGTQMFDTSHKQRTPAYTDRILYKYHPGRGVLQCLYYSSVQSICTSDHKPVWGLYSTAVRPGIDTIPLAAGLFNREVYLEGIKRRAAALDRSQGTSAICSIQ